MPNDCLFCRIVSGEIPAKIVAQDDDSIAFRDITPQAPTHVVIIPRTHVASLEAATDAEMIGKLALMASRVARDEGIDKSGYRAVINSGPDAGQTVFHIHMHLLGGRAMKWPPG